MDCNLFISNVVFAKHDQGSLVGDTREQKGIQGLVAVTAPTDKFILYLSVLQNGKKCCHIFLKVRQANGKQFQKVIFFFLIYFFTFNKKIMLLNITKSLQITYLFAPPSCTLLNVIFASNYSVCI
jgi:hypothetical protein